ncbi:MAG: beta-lactamase family protein [Alphaproteobacteria bacterium]|nr:beta-lactamase family protein [Alphaproteobacteria bacterium]
MVDVHGTCDYKFAAVKKAFSRNFSEHQEHGASIAIKVGDELVVDLWAGHADRAKQRPWARDTLTNVWSSTKGVVAAAIAIAVDNGHLHYDKPIADVWPEFAVNGKQRITLDQVLSHVSGLNGLNTPINEQQLCEWFPYIDALAAMRPHFTPGSACAYHALSYGHLAGETLRRATGQSIGAFVNEKICKPLGIEFFIGVPEAQDHRCAQMVVGEGASSWVAQVLASPYPQACRNPTPDPFAPDRREWRSAEVPGGNGHSDARGLASIYADLASNKPKLLSYTARDEATRLRFSGVDESFNLPTAFAAGFRLGDELYPTAKCFGHGGWGGTLAFGDPTNQLGFAYVTNTMLGFDKPDPRRKALITAAYAGFS